MQYVTTISSKGQITLPAKLRKSLNLDYGDRVTITKRGQKISIEPDSYEARLADLRIRTNAHLKKHKIKPLSDTDLDKKINEAWTQSSIDRYEKSA